MIPSSRRLELVLALVIFSIASTIAFYQLGARHFWVVDHEARAALAARDIDRGFSGVQELAPYPVAYPAFPTMMAAIFHISGHQDEYTARLLPAALSLGSLVVTGLAAAALYGPLGGVFAAGVLSTSFLFSYFARSAAPDMAVNFFSSLAFLAFVHGVKSGKRGWIWLFWLILGFCFHTGGAAVVAVPLGGLIFAAHRGRLGPRGVGEVIDAVGILLFLVVIFPGLVHLRNFPAPVILWEESASPAEAIMGFALGLLLFFPWVFALPATLRAQLAQGDKLGMAAMEFLAGALMAGLLFAFAGFSHPLPLHAPMALLVAGFILHSQRWALDPTDTEGLWTAPLISHVIIIVPLVVFVGVSILPVWSPAAPFPPRLSFMALLAAVYISHKSMSRFAQRGETWGIWTAAIVSSFSFLLYFHGAIAPSLNRSMSHKVFYHQAADFMGDLARLYFYRFDSAQARFYLDVKPRLAVDQAQLSRILDQEKTGEGAFYFLTDGRGKPDIDKAMQGASFAAPQFIDSYFVPLTAAREEQRLYILQGRSQETRLGSRP